MMERRMSTQGHLLSSKPRVICIHAVLWIIDAYKHANIHIWTQPPAMIAILAISCGCMAAAALLMIFEFSMHYAPHNNSKQATHFISLYGVYTNFACLLYRSGWSRLDARGVVASVVLVLLASVAAALQLRRCESDSDSSLPILISTNCSIICIHVMNWIIDAYIHIWTQPPPMTCLWQLISHVAACYGRARPRRRSFPDDFRVKPDAPHNSEQAIHFKSLYVY